MWGNTHFCQIELQCDGWCLSREWIHPSTQALFSGVFTVLLFTSVALFYQIILNYVWGFFYLVLDFLQVGCWFFFQIHSLILSFSNFIFYEAEKLLLFNFITTKLHFQYFCRDTVLQVYNLGTQMYSNTVFWSGVPGFLGSVECLEIIHWSYF